MDRRGVLRALRLKRRGCNCYRGTRIRFLVGSGHRVNDPVRLAGTRPRATVADKVMKSAEDEWTGKAGALAQTHASEARRPGRAGGDRDQSRMAATRHEAQGTAREPNGGTPGGHSLEISSPSLLRGLKSHI